MARVLVRFLAATALALASAPALALADEHRALSAPPPGTLELTLATGYSSGVEALDTTDLAIVTQPAIGARVGAGLRLVPAWTVAIVGSYEETTATTRGAAYAAGGALQLTWHLDPDARIAPWIDAAIGYRQLVDQPIAATSRHASAFDVARFVVGADIRPSDMFAVGPALGAGASVLVADGTRFGAFVFIGLQGRFDLAASVD